MRPFPADADKRSQKSDPSSPVKDGAPAPLQAGPKAPVTKTDVTLGKTADKGAAPAPHGPQPPVTSGASPNEPPRGRLESRYQAHKRVALGAISTKPTAASGLPANTEPAGGNPDAMEEAMRQAWSKVFGKKG